MLYSDLLRRNAARFPHKMRSRWMTDPIAGPMASSTSASAPGERLERPRSPGDRVALLSENNLEYIEAYYGVPTAGMVLTLLNYRLHPKEWVWILNDSGARVLMVESKYLEVIADYRSELTSIEHIIVIGEPATGVHGLQGRPPVRVDQCPAIADQRRRRRVDPIHKRNNG